MGGEDFYIDLLFYNVMLHSYIVVELKNTAFKPEYTGKLTFYVSAVDGELRGEGDNPTIGLLLCKEKNDVVAEYALKDINQPIGVSEYRLGDVLPGDFRSTFLRLRLCRIGFRSKADALAWGPLVLKTAIFGNCNCRII